MKLPGKKKRVSIKGVVPVHIVVAVVLLPAVIVGCLSLGSRCEAIGKELKALDSEITELKRKCANEEERWMWMKSPAELDKALRRWHLQMTWPDEQKVVRLTQEDVTDAFSRVARARRTQFAQIGRRMAAHD